MAGKISGFALIKGSDVTVMVGRQLREVMEIARNANMYAPRIMTKVARVTYVYEGMGKVSNVKVGKII